MRGWGEVTTHRCFWALHPDYLLKNGISPAQLRGMLHAAAHMLDVQFGQASDFGKVRTNNEDAMGSFIPASRQQARSHGFLFVVADGENVLFLDGKKCHG